MVPVPGGQCLRSPLTTCESCIEPISTTKTTTMTTASTMTTTHRLRRLSEWEMKRVVNDDKFPFIAIVVDVYDHQPACSERLWRASACVCSRSSAGKSFFPWPSNRTGVPGIAWDGRLAFLCVYRILAVVQSFTNIPATHVRCIANGLLKLFMFFVATFHQTHLTQGQATGHL